jgi:hypothetical protein
VPGVGGVQLAGLLARQGHQFGERVDVERGWHRHRDDGARHAGKRNDVVQVVGQFGVLRRVGRKRAGRGEQQGVQVTGRCERVDRVDTVGAWPVLDDDRLAPALGQLVGEQARGDVLRASGALADDEPDRTLRPSLRGGAVQ